MNERINVMLKPTIPASAIYCVPIICTFEKEGVDDGQRIRFHS